MTIETRKINLIKIITELNDVSRIQVIENLLFEDADWWDKIGEEERNEIDEGILQADNGLTKSHGEFMERYQKWL